MAIAAVLLHDTGYLRVRSDRDGTGAKYTYCHVLRSCAFAASYLPTLGANDYEVEAVLGAINCTGPTKQVSRLYFREPVERIVGCALATADYLGQMAAADYPDELEILFNEFKESDSYIHLPPSRRTFKSAADLINQTPAFWRKWVLPKLESDYQAMYRFLARPYPQGSNAYLDGVERNIAKVERRIAGKKGKSGLNAPDLAATLAGHACDDFVRGAPGHRGRSRPRRGQRRRDRRTSLLFRRPAGHRGQGVRRSRVCRAQ
jgi:hypothetical protein